MHQFKDSRYTSIAHLKALLSSFLCALRYPELEETTLELAIVEYELYLYEHPGEYEAASKQAFDIVQETIERAIREENEVV